MILIYYYYYYYYFIQIEEMSQLCTEWQNYRY